MGPEERIAVLGHELAHDVNRDLREANALVGTALTSINHWLLLLSRPPRASLRTGPARRRRNARSVAIANIERVVPLLFLPLFGIVAIVGTVLRRLSDRARQRSEYLADDLARRIAGKGHATSMLAKELVGESCIQSIITASRQGSTDLWRSEREFIESIPDYEVVRRRLVAAARVSRTGSHPFADSRMKLIEAQPDSVCRVPYLARQMSDIDLELIPWSRSIERDMRQRHPASVTTSRVGRSDGAMSSPVAGESIPAPASN
jgi:heat shock protein HtpX